MEFLLLVWVRPKLYLRCCDIFPCCLMESEYEEEINVELPGGLGEVGNDITEISAAGQYVLESMAATTKRGYALFVSQYRSYVEESHEAHSDRLVRDWISSLKDKYAASSLWSGLSHVKKFIHEDQGCAIDSWPLTHELLRTMQRHQVQRKAPAFTREQVLRFLKEYPVAEGVIVRKVTFSFVVYAEVK